MYGSHRGMLILVLFERGDYKGLSFFFNFSLLNSITSQCWGRWPNQKHLVPQADGVSLLSWFPGIIFFPLFKSCLIFKALFKCRVFYGAMHNFPGGTSFFNSQPPSFAPLLWPTESFISNYTCLAYYLASLLCCRPMRTYPRSDSLGVVHSTGSINMYWLN